MTLEEAGEYLNLPANSRKQLVRKRYLELKKDYLKAIHNAPSDHFSSLYQENLQKIEEAYRFLIEELQSANDNESQIQLSIKQIQLVLSKLLQEKKTLDSQSKKTLKDYIQKIDQLKNMLAKDTMEPDLQTESSQTMAGDHITGVPQLRTKRARQYLYDRLLMGTIIAIVVLGILGALYVMFPLFF